MSFSTEGVSDFTNFLVQAFFTKTPGEMFLPNILLIKILWGMSDFDELNEKYKGMGKRY